MISAALCAVSLAAPLQFESPGAPLDQLLPELSRLSGVSLRADARTAEDVLAVRMDGQSLEWFMERAAWASGAAWRQTPEGWLLERTAAQESALIRQAASRQASTALAHIKTAAPLLPQVFALYSSQKPEEAKKLLAENFDDPEAVGEAFQQALAGELIEAIGIQSILALPVGQTVRYAARPNRLERPLTPAMRQGIRQAIARQQLVVRLAMQVEPDMQVPELMAQLNRAPNLDAASIDITRSGSTIVLLGMTGETGQLGMGLVGPLQAVFSTLPKVNSRPEGHPFGDEKPQALPIDVEGIKTEEVIERFVQTEPLAESVGEPMVKAAERAGSSFVAMLPDSLLQTRLRSPFGQPDSPIGLIAPEAPETPGLPGHFEWKDGAGRPWMLGRAIESQFSRKAMGEILNRHLNRQEGVLTAALAVRSKVRPAAWGGPYLRMVESAFPWLHQGLGLAQISESYALFQFLGSLPSGMIKALSQEPMTRFDPGLIVRAEDALSNTNNAMFGQLGRTAPIDGVTYEFPLDRGLMAAKAALGMAPAGGAQYKLSGSVAGQILAYDARQGRLQVLAPTELGAILGAAEDPRQADSRAEMPDFRSFSMVNQTTWTLSARIVNSANEVSIVSASLTDTLPPTGDMAGLNRLPKSVIDAIEAGRKFGRNGGGIRASLAAAAISSGILLPPPGV